MLIDHQVEPHIYRFVIRPLAEDPRSHSLLSAAHALGISKVEQLICQDLYFIEGFIDEAGLQRLACELLSDPITQAAQWGRLISAQSFLPQPGEPFMVEVALLPGVTDPVAEQVVRAAAVLGVQGLSRAATGQRFLVSGTGLAEEDVRLLTRRLLANPIIQRFTLGEIEPAFPHPALASARVELLPLRQLDAPGLLALSAERRAALDLPEMRAIQRYFQAEGREPTDVEIETIAQTWSEHCVHKTFRAKITLSNTGEQEIDGLLKTTIRAASEQIGAAWVRSAFVDNAGIIDFDEEFEVSFKVETHNHPSAIEPFGGANTGTGGVIRDVLGVSAKPIAATDILCFGPQDLPFADLPEGVLHPRRIRAGVVAGVQDYGNKIGIPTVNGAILYDPGYTANPLVFCGCVGIAPKNSHPRDPQVGDLVVVLGGRTGRDGLRGATFSSMTMDGMTGEVSGASVQIGDPITEKGVIEVVVRARDQKIYHAITDCGAGGLSSAVGEMGRVIGAEVELKDVPLKYPGLAPWEIWLSEAQERMVLAVPPDNLPRLRALCATFDVALTVIGKFTGSGRLVVKHAGEVVLDLENEFLHHGIPQRALQAALPIPPTGQFTPPSSLDVNQTLLDLLAHPDIASKSDVVRIYDFEVQGGTVVKPLTGESDEGPSDACVLKPLGARGRRGIVLSNGINPFYGKVDPYRMAAGVVDEAIRNAVAVGADPERIALLDNFCWGDPKRPETLGALVAAARGCSDAAVHHQAPFISGKDSLNNEYTGADGQRHAIPPTLLISAIGLIEDIDRSVTMDLKAPGDLIYRIGEFQPAFGGSHFALLHPPEGSSWGAAPGPSPLAPRLYRALHRAMSARLARACHDLSEGGLAVAAAEMCIGGRLGLSLQLDGEEAVAALFGETNGCLLVEVEPQNKQAFEECLAGLPITQLGQVIQEPVLKIAGSPGSPPVSLPLDALCSAWGVPL